MTELELTGGCIVFHIYKNGEKDRSYDFFDNDLEGISYNVVKESSLDLTKYEEIHIRQESYDDTFYGLKEELPDDYELEVEVTHVLLPNGESYDIMELIDEHIDIDTFETSSGDSFVEYSKITPDGIESIEDDDIIEEDSMW